MKNYLSKIVCISILCIAASFASSASARTLVYAISLPLSSHYGAAAQAFKKKVETLSNNKLEVSIKPSSVLGGEREYVESMQIGALDMAMSATGPVAQFVPDLYAFTLPFLFKNVEIARKVLDSPIADQVLSELKSINIKGLAFGENGYRYITNSKRSVKTPEDLKGLKLRVMETDILLAAFKSAGASPLPMPWPEVIPALQQGTIDGQETIMSALISNRFWEFQKYLTLSGHTFSPTIFMMSMSTWNSLSSKEKNWVREGIKIAVDTTYKHVRKDEKEGVKIMRKHGVKVVTDIDQNQWENAMHGAYDYYNKHYNKKLLDKIRAEIKKSK
jgi:tripartite ATP-independent transporter DctP family solute receptor